MFFNQESYNFSMQRKKLTRKERRKIVEDIIGPVPWDKFEPGIYNYCDRWCEKCDKTARCFLYYDISGDESNGEDPFESIGKSLAQTHELITAISKAEGIDIALTEEDIAEFEKEEELTDPHDDPLYIEGSELVMKLHNFIDSVDLIVDDKYENAYESVIWHHTLFMSKLGRAIWGRKEAKIESGMMRKFSNEDARKSAYVAHRSLKICADSLDLMSRYLPNDSTVDTLVLSCHDLLNKISLEFKL